MDIIVISHFCMDFSEKDNDRFLYISKELSQNNDVEIITSDFFHTQKRHRNKVLYKQPFKVTFLHEPGYKKNVCIKRFYSHYVWGMQVKKYLMRRKKPDVIYCAIPSLTAPFQVARYCKKNDIRFVIDIQDLWPEAFQMVINIPFVSNILFSPFRFVANYIYKKANAIVAVSATYLKRALKVNKKCNSFEVVFLGTQLSDFDDNCKCESIINKKENELWLGYCGTLGASYDIKCVIDAISVLSDNVKRPKFIVMGDGDKMQEFIDYSQAKGVDSVFLGRIAYDKMCRTLTMCDIVVNPIVKGSAGSIINKHADYAASGLPVLNTQESKEYRALVKKFKMGINCRNEDYVDLSKKLEILISNSELRKKMGLNARRCAEECFDRKNTYKKIIRIIER